MKTILKIKSWSHLYWTATPTSDVDYLWVFIPEVKYYTWLEKIEELDQWIKSVWENWKNTQDAVDCKLYELRHYCRLAMKNNPNILEMLFANKENIEEITKEWQILVDNAHLFPYAWLIKTYFWYAKSQEHKMTMKVDNRQALELAQRWLDKQDPQKRVLDLDHPFDKKWNDHFKIWDIMVPVTAKVSQVLNKYVGKRLEQASRRAKMREESGYDHKFASHLIRLLLQAKQLLTHGSLSFPIPESTLVTDIKLWKMKLDDVLHISKWLKEEIRLIEKWWHNLPTKPRYDEINELLMSITSNYLLENLK